MKNQPKPEALLDTLKTAEKAKVKLTLEIEQEIREHLAEAQARAERGEPMTQEMVEFMENVRLWVGMPEEWREKLRTVEVMRKDPEIIRAPTEAKQRHISVQQWLDLLHLNNVISEKSGKKHHEKTWINTVFQFLGGREIFIAGSLDLSFCKNLNRLPEGLKVGEILELRGCTGLKSLPERLEVGENLDLEECTWLTELSETLKLGGSLHLDRCTSLTSLPNSLKLIRGVLDLTGCTGLTGLPEGLKVERDLRLEGCTGLARLPKGLEVGGDLYLSEDLQPRVTEDAERLKKQGKIKGRI